MLTPEINKKIAEALGYEVVMSASFGLIEDCSVLTPNKATSDYEPFNPETNDSQLLECMTYLIDNDWTIGKDNYEYTIFTPTIDDVIIYKAKTPKQAVIAVLKEIFKDE